MNDPIARYRLAEVARCRAADVVDLAVGDFDLVDVAIEIAVGGAEQGEVPLVGDREDYAPIIVLEDVATLVIEELVDDDVAALDEAHIAGRVATGGSAEYPINPRARGIDHHAGRDLFGCARSLVLRCHLPKLAGQGNLGDSRSGSDDGTAVGRIAGIQHDEAGIVHPAIRIFERPAETRLQWCSRRILAQIEHARGRQAASPADMVVEKEAQPQEPDRPLFRRVRQDEPQWPDDMGRHSPEHFAFFKRLADQAEGIMLKVTQTAMDQFR